MAVDQKFREFRVNSLPSSGLQAGDRYYLSVGGGKYKTFIVSDNLVLTGDAGSEFLDKDTMAQMRALSSREIWAIQNGYYKGVRLHGYYAKGDTPAPIDYYFSTTSEPDNGGSVIIIPAGLKLEHDFKDSTNIKYWGAIPDGTTDNRPYINNALLFCKKVFIDSGVWASSVESGGYGTRGINLQNGSDLVLASDATIIQISGDLGIGNLLGVNNKSNVKITGGSFIGDKNRHLTPDGTYWKQFFTGTDYEVDDYVYINTWGLKVIVAGTTGTSTPNLSTSSTPVGTVITTGTAQLEVVFATGLGERVHGFWINNSKNITITNVNFNEFWGDGVYIGGASDATFRGGEDVLLENVTCDDNRRQGISIVQAEKVTARSCNFSNTKGTNPRAGIDIEPNDLTHWVKDVTLDTCRFDNNEGSAIEIAVHKRGPFVDGVTVINCYLNGGRFDAVGWNNIPDDGQPPVPDFKYDTVRNIKLINSFVNVDNRDNAVRFQRCKSFEVINTNITKPTVNTRTVFGLQISDNCSDFKINGASFKNFPQKAVRIDNTCSDFSLKNNLASNCGDFMHISESTNYVVADNLGHDLNGRGCWLVRTTDAMVVGNTYKHNGQGSSITLDTECDGVTVRSNVCINVRTAGCQVVGNSNNNIVTGNTFVSYGTTMRGVNTLTATGTGNLVGLNNFLGNFTAAKQSLSAGTSLFPKLEYDGVSTLSIEDGSSVDIQTTKLPVTSRQDGMSVEPAPTMIPFRNTSPESSNYPSASGSGLYVQGRDTSMGAFTIYKGNSSDLSLYLMNSEGEYLPFQLISSGSTANRPTTGLYPGRIYFDTTLGFNVTYSGSGWVDSTGTSV